MHELLPKHESSKRTTFRIYFLLVLACISLPARGEGERDRSDNEIVANRKFVIVSADQPGKISKEDNVRIVSTIQRELNSLNCNAGPVDGDWGPQSAQALRRFQQSIGVNAKEAKPLPDTLNLLRDHRTTRCADVKRKKRTSRSGKPSKRRNKVAAKTRIKSPEVATSQAGKKNRPVKKTKNNGRRAQRRGDACISIIAGVCASGGN